MTSPAARGRPSARAASTVSDTAACSGVAPWRSWKSPTSISARMSGSSFMSGRSRSFRKAGVELEIPPYGAEGDRLCRRARHAVARECKDHVLEPAAARCDGHDASSRRRADRGPPLRAQTSTRPASGRAFEISPAVTTRRPGSCMRVSASPPSPVMTTTPLASARRIVPGTALRSVATTAAS